jgi:hypothetical protein
VSVERGAAHLLFDLLRKVLELGVHSLPQLALALLLLQLVLPLRKYK